MTTSTRHISPNKNKRASLIVPVTAKTSFEQSRSCIASSSPPRRESIASSTTTYVSTESDYLTALAAQERKVLELKEQLSKAEEELQKLKKQWANHESAKRRDERVRLHQMKPMAASPKVNREDDEDGTNAWMYEEMARRKALLNNTKTSHRRVFSGSRQTKALSLLEAIEAEETEPAYSNDPATAPKPIKTSPRVNAEVRRSRELVKKNTLRPPRASTTPNLWQSGDFVMDPMSWARADSRSPQREAILRTGKQVATDLREGLWTFLEDLRQVAIGDEPRPAQEIVQAQSRQNSKPTSQRPARSTKSTRDDYSVRLTSDNDKAWQDEDAGEIFSKEHGLPAPTLIEPAIVRPARNSGSNTPLKARPGPRPPQAVAAISDSESWETWDSPPRAQVSYQGLPDLSSTSTLSTVSANSTPGTANGEYHHAATSTESTPKQPASRDGIPWPDLGKLGPPAAAFGGHLRRTASHMMQEWERSLSPSPVNSPGDGKTSEVDFLSSGQDVLH